MPAQCLSLPEAFVAHEEVPRSLANTFTMISLGFRALQEDGVKVLVVRLLVEAKRTSTDNKFEEGRRKAFTQLFCHDCHFLPEDCLVLQAAEMCLRVV